MATVLHSENRRLYSWWWDSHISPKNSRWLQENLTDMDAKVKAMIKLIEEDADSFARRAEMYYKKRPELMKLVEEFYRAYRALAERYDYATVELRQAHRTMAEAFPNQVPFMLAECSSSDSSPPEAEPQTPEMPHPIRALLDPDELHRDALGLSSSNLHAFKRSGTVADDSESGRSKKGLKQINLMFGSEVMPPNLKLAKERICEFLNHSVDEKDQNGFSDHQSKAESVVQSLKKALAEVKVEKEALFLQYQQNLERLAILDSELNHAQNAARTLDECACKAETEVITLREALATLEAERDAGLHQQKQSLEKISNLEIMVSRAHTDATGLNERAIQAETEAQNLKVELLRLEAEKETNLLQYKQCLEKVSALEDKILRAEEDARKLIEQTDRAEIEVQVLKKALADSNEEKEAIAMQNKECLEAISKLESELSCAQEDVTRLNSENLVGMKKLKSAEEHCVELGRSNRSLQLEAENVAKKMAIKDQELLLKNVELEKLQVCVQNEHSRLLQVEATLKTLQDLHSQSQEDHRALVWEVKNGLQLLKDSEKCKQELEREIQRISKENQSLNDLNLSSTILMKDMQNETFNLRKTKGKLEVKVAEQLDQIKALQRDIYHLKEEIKCLNRRYQALVEQLESVGLNPDCVASSVKALQDENSMLKEFCEKDRDEKEALLKKLGNEGILLEKNAVLESSLLDVTGKLEGAREEVKSLQESYGILLGEKSILVAEKSALFSQLQSLAENMQKLLEKNTILEVSFSAANVELEGLRARSESLGQACHLLGNEKSNLLSEREMLVSKLEGVEQSLESLEKRFVVLEERHASMEKEKGYALHQVEELRVSLGVEKQERVSFMLSSEARLVGLENHVLLLQEESRWTRKEFEEELDKAVNAQVEIFILQRCVLDMEEKYFCLLMDCEQYIEASKMSEKLILELESENLEQQVELEFLLDEIKNFKTGIYKIFTALRNDQEKELEVEKIVIPQINKRIEHMKSYLLTIEDEKQQLLVENSVLCTLIGELRLEGRKLKSKHETINQEFTSMGERFAAMQNNKHALQDLNGQLKLEVSMGNHREELLKAETDSLIQKFIDLQENYCDLQRGNSKANEEYTSLLKDFFKLKDEMCLLEGENSSIFLEAMSFSYLSLIYSYFGIEKAEELKALAEDLSKLDRINSDSRKEVKIYGEKLDRKEVENSHLKDSVEKLDKELYEAIHLNDQLNRKILAGMVFLSHKERELLEAEDKVRCTQNLNTQLCSTIEGLESECGESELMREILEEQISELSKHGSDLSKEIECLREVNDNLLSETSMLHMEVDECRIREENLSSELRERSNEFELCEAEAEKFYFDLQISVVCEVLSENKVHELTSLCESLEGETALKSAELELMKERVSSLEGELGKFRAQLTAFDPVICSLKDSVASLECNAIFRTTCCLDGNQKQEDEEVIVDFHGEHCEHEGQTSVVAEGISDLQEMLLRIKAVEKAVVEEMKRLTMKESLNTNVKLEAAMEEIEELKSKNTSHQQKWAPGDEVNGDFELQKTEPERNGILMKDIPLDQVLSCSLDGMHREESARMDDQMLVLWETDEKGYGRDPSVCNTQKQAPAIVDNDVIRPHFEDTKQENRNTSSELTLEKELSVDKLEVSTRVTHPRRDENKINNILERFASDAQKLQSLQTTVQDLKRTMDANRKSKKGKIVEYEAVEEQLQETEEALAELVDINTRLMMDSKESPSSLNGEASTELEEAGNAQRKSTLEQAQKGSEKIGRLQLEVQKIQYVLLKLDEEKKSRGRKGFSGIRISRSNAIFRDIIYRGGRSSGRKKKGCFCGCLSTLSSPDGDQGMHI